MLSLKVRLVILIAYVALLSSCQRAPSVNILGSFFPIWIFCMIAGILLTIAVRGILIRFRLESELGPLIVIYPSLAATFACNLWLLLFRY